MQRKEKRGQSGYLFIEMLMAMTVFGLASTGIFTGVLQAVKAQDQLHRAQQSYFIQALLWERMENDFHNMIVLEAPVFSGREQEISFPVLRPDSADSKIPSVVQVRYFVEGDAFVRSVTDLHSGLGIERSDIKTILKNVRSVQFLYPYKDEKDRVVLLPFWLDKPYNGPPRAVCFKVIVAKPEQTFEKWIEMPLGHYGQVPSSERQAPGGED